MKKSLKWLAASLVLFSSCKKDEVNNPQPAIPAAKGIYVLSEGTFGGNNSKLAFRESSSATVYPDFFLQQNPAQTGGLGDTGNDMIVYGGKVYIVMNNSANVTVLDASNGHFLGRISFLNGTINKNPRYAVGARGRIFVTSYNNTVSVIDTTALAIINSITVGSNPEHIIVSGDRLYVANSGGLNYPDVDSTVSVINLNTLTEERRVTVGLNPQRLAVNAEGDIWVTGYGDAFAAVPIPAFVKVIDASTHQLVQGLPDTFKFDHVRVFENRAYLFNNYGGGNVKLVDANAMNVIRDSFITDGTTISNVYAVDIDEQNGDVFICDSKDFISAGEVFCFDREGRKKYSFSVSPGISPNKISFLR
ncbi:MAG: YncE family protein [Chitinophagaceae bacterium]|nr:MAG: YncE family protein [Chitinophagaceae bacterium]